VQQTIPVTFPRRGVYRQEAFRIVTRFPFGSSASAPTELENEALVYPSVERALNTWRSCPACKGAESLTKGRAMIYMRCGLPSQ